MKLEIYMYRLKKPADTSVLKGLDPEIRDISGASFMRALYVAGASFRIARGSPINAVAFALPSLSREAAEKLDGLRIRGIYAAKLPDASSYGRMVFYALPEECPYELYPRIYQEAFARFAVFSGIGGAIYDNSLADPRSMIFGHPYPRMAKDMEPIAFPQIREPRPIVKKAQGAEKSERHMRRIRQQAANARAHRRIGNILEKKIIGSRPRYKADTLEELAALYKAGKISASCYFGRRRENFIKGRVPKYKFENLAELDHIYHTTNMSRPWYDKCRKALIAKNGG